MGFLELRQVPGVYSRVTAAMAIRNPTLISKVRTPVELRRTPQESKLGLKAVTSFTSQDEGMSESSVDTLEKTLVPRLIWTGGLTSLYTSRGFWSSMLQR